MGEKRTVTVACTIPNGIMLNLFKPGYDDGTGDGVKPTVRDGVGVRLNGPSSLHTGAGGTFRGDLAPGVTRVDGDWWDKWAEQNRLNPMFMEKMIYVTEEEGLRPL